MSLAPRHGGPSDRPLLRIFEPDLNAPLTVKSAHEQFRVPELAKRSKGYRLDCGRALAKWEEFETLIAAQSQRIAYPLPINAITSSVIRSFQGWLTETTCLSPSSVNKIVREILTTIALAGDDGYQVNTVRCKRLPEPVGSKIYLDELQIACLWSSAESMDWPPSGQSRRFGGTFMPPSTFWRGAMILLRAYGMRVQDLIAYQVPKVGVAWSDISFEPRTPNPNGREEWALGWFYYQSAKVGRKYYLPLTKYTRAAIDRLRRAAEARAAAAGLSSVPGDWPILPCPAGGLPRRWKTLCAAARVTKPIQLIGVESRGPDKWAAVTSVGERLFADQAEAEAWLATAADYVMEDFRSTAATFYAAIEESLPNKVCGWADGSKVNVGRKNYINDEPVLIKHLPTAPMPRCFDDWLDSTK
jgi:hypothetical protein